MEALQSRHDYFHNNGCRLSDHGLNYLPFESYSIMEVQTIFNKLLKGLNIEEGEGLKIKTAILLVLGKMDHARGWTQQYNLGPLCNTNKRLYDKLGPDACFDSFGDFPQAASMAKFFGE